MTYEVPKDTPQGDIAIVERMHELLHNEFGIPLDEYLVTASGSGDFHVTTGEGVGDMDSGHRVVEVKDPDGTGETAKALVMKEDRQDVRVKLIEDFGSHGGPGATTWLQKSEVEGL